MDTITPVLKSLRMLDHETVEIRYHDAVTVSVEDMEDLLKHLYAFTGNKRLKRLVVCTKILILDQRPGNT